MRSAAARLAIAATFAFFASSTCRADVYEPGMAWVYNSPETLYVVRMVEDHKCYFAMFSRSGKFGDAGQCKFVADGRGATVDLTVDGMFPNGLALTNLKQLSFVYLPDSDTLTSLTPSPKMSFVRMSNESALKLMADR